MFLTETWQRDSDHSSLIELCPAGFSFIGRPRPSGRGGGVAAVFRNRLMCRSVSVGQFSSFELQMIKVGDKDPFYCAVVYRPPGPNSLFLNEFSDFLSSTMKLSKLIVLGDFNFHNFNCSDDSDLFTRGFSSVMDSFNFTQHVCGPTHVKGGTLDLVFTLGVNIDSIFSEDIFISDHHCIFFNLSFSVSLLPARREISSRILNSSSADAFSNAFNLVLPPCTDVNALLGLFNSHCRSTLDEVCPIKTRLTPVTKASPWINDSIRRLKQSCRKVERLWKKTRLHVHLLYLKDLLVSFNNAVKDARATYFTNLISKSRGNPKVLFNTISDIVMPRPPAVPIHSNDDCETFLSFFIEKVRSVRNSMRLTAASASVSSPSPPRPVILDTFSPVSLPELVRLVGTMKSSSCSLDLLPTPLLKDVFQSIGPCVLSIINSSLLSGQVPELFKEAVIAPLFKKPGLDPSLLSSYRPISNLSFISKLLEKVVAKQLTAALDRHAILDQFQSGFRRAHSTETALLRVTNDMLMQSDAGNCSVLLLLDLTAAFDTVDHHVLLDRLKNWVGVSGSALDWFTSYLTGRSFSVVCSKFKSSSASLTSGVPQGSVLGPLLFILYLLPLYHILSSFNDISYHFYADDIQLYVSFKPQDVFKIQILHKCLDSVKSWMNDNFLQLNETKTEVLV
uniref:Reverse transcriptase domain-containing protein n=1 Tax=Oryzias melastigma TaxID=30732 RepID=A0A3B3BU57_ORYME